MPWAERRGTGWIIRGYENGKKVTLAVCPTREIKNQKMVDLDKDKGLRRLGLPNLDRNIEVALDQWLAEDRLEPATHRVTEEAVRLFIKEQSVIQFKDVTREVVKVWRSKMLARGNKNNTLSIRLRSLRAWLNKMDVVVDFKGLVPDNETAGKVIPKDDINKLMDRMPSDLRRIFVFGLNTGLRPTEIIERARWEKLEGRYLTLPKTKNRKVRTIFLNDEAMAQIGAKRNEGKIFEGWDYARLKRAFYRVTRSIDLEFRMYDTRHTWTTLFLRHPKGSLSGAMHWRGDKSLRSLEPYLHEMREHLKEDSQVIRFSGHLVGNGTQNMHNNGKSVTNDQIGKMPISRGKIKTN